MEPVTQFVSTLFASRTQAHVFHLQTTSFAQHKALNDYYDEIVDLTDSFIEAYQGKYSIIRGYSSPGVFREDDNTVKYFEGLGKYVDLTRERLPQDTYLQNIVDEIVGLIQSTIYKLKYLR